MLGNLSTVFGQRGVLQSTPFLHLSCPTAKAHLTADPLPLNSKKKVRDHAAYIFTNNDRIMLKVPSVPLVQMTLQSVGRVVTF